MSTTWTIDELAALVVGEVEQGREHPRSQLDADLVDPVERLADRQAVEDVLHPRADLLEQLLHQPGGQGQQVGSVELGLGRDAMRGVPRGDELVHRHSMRPFPLPLQGVNRLMNLTLTLLRYAYASHGGATPPAAK